MWFFFANVSTKTVKKGIAELFFQFLVLKCPFLRTFHKSSDKFPHFTPKPWDPSKILGAISKPGSSHPSLVYEDIIIIEEPLKTDISNWRQISLIRDMPVRSPMRHVGLLTDRSVSDGFPMRHVGPRGSVEVCMLFNRSALSHVCRRSGISVSNGSLMGLL